MGYGGGGGGGSGGGGGGSGGSYAGGGGGGGSSSASPPRAGAFRFNTDSSQLEIYDGNQWTGVLATSPEQLTGGARGVAGGGWNPSTTNLIKYYTIASTGNEESFGNLTRSGRNFSACGSRIRGVFGGSFPQANQTVMDYITFSSPGDAIDFGDMSLGRTGNGSFASSTRGVFAGGYSYSPGPGASSNVIDYITIAATGNAVDFGDLANPKEFNNNPGCSSPTRGLWMATASPSAASANTIEYVTIATTGNSSDFGDITDTGTRSSGGACSNAIRALYGGGANPSVLNTIDYLTIATLGNTVDFGDLTSARYHQGVFSSSTRGVWLGGRTPDLTNVIDYVQISSTGNAVDWGDMYDQIGLFATTSNGHGGL